MTALDEKTVIEVPDSKAEGDRMMEKQGESPGSIEIETTKYEQGGPNGGNGTMISRSGVDGYAEQHSRKDLISKQLRKLTPPPPPPVSVRGIGGMGYGNVMNRVAVLAPPWKSDSGEDDDNMREDDQSLSEMQEQSTTDEVTYLPPSSGPSMASSRKGSHDSPHASQTPSMEVWSTLSVPSERGGDILWELGSMDNSSAISTAQDALTTSPGMDACWTDSHHGDVDCHHPSLDPLRKAALLAREPSTLANKRFGGLREECGEQTQANMGMRPMTGGGGGEGGAAGSSVDATNGTCSERFGGESDDAFSAVTEEDVASSIAVPADLDKEDVEYEQPERLDGSWSPRCIDQSDRSPNTASRSFHYNHFDDRGKSWNSMDYHLEARNAYVVQSQECDVPSPFVENNELPGPPNDLFGGGGDTGDAIDGWDPESSAIAVEINNGERIPRGDASATFMPTEVALNGPSGGLFTSSHHSHSTGSDITSPNPLPIQECSEIFDFLPSHLFPNSSSFTELPSPNHPLADHPVKGNSPPLASVVIEADESTAVPANGGAAAVAPPIDFNVVNRNSTHQAVCDPWGGSVGSLHSTEASAPPPTSLYPTQRCEFGSRLPPHGGVPPRPISTDSSSLSSPPVGGDLHGLPPYPEQSDDGKLRQEQQSTYSSSNVAAFNDSSTIPVFHAKQPAQSQVSGVPTTLLPPENGAVGQQQQHGTTAENFGGAFHAPLPAEKIEFNSTSKKPQIAAAALPPDHGATPHNDAVVVGAAAVACPPPHTYKPGAEDELYQRRHVPISTTTSVNVSAEEVTFSSAPCSSSSLPQPPPPHSACGTVCGISQEKNECSTFVKTSPPTYPGPSSPRSSTPSVETFQESGDFAASALPVNNSTFVPVRPPPAVAPPPFGSDNAVISDLNPSHAVAAPFSMKQPSQQEKSSSAQQPDNGGMRFPGSHFPATSTFENVQVHDHGGPSAAGVFGTPPAAGFHSSAIDLSLPVEQQKPVETPATEDLGGPPDGMFGDISPSNELSTAVSSHVMQPVDVAASCTDDFSDPSARMFGDEPTGSANSLFNSTPTSSPMNDSYSPVPVVDSTTMFGSHPPPSYENTTFTAPAAATLAACSQVGGHIPAESRTVAHNNISHFDEAASSAVVASDAVHQKGVVPQFGGHLPGRSMFQASPAGVSAAAEGHGEAQNAFFYQSASDGYSTTSPPQNLDPSCASLPQATAENHPVSSPPYPNTTTFYPPHHVVPAAAADPGSLPIHRGSTDTATSEVPIFFPPPNIIFGGGGGAAASVPTTMEKAKSQSHRHQLGRQPSHAIVSLGFGGRLVIVQPYSRTAEIWNVKNVTTLSRDMARDVEEFPGPAETGRLGDITRFCEMKAAGRNGEGESERLIWGSVLISLKHRSQQQAATAVASQVNGCDGGSAPREKELAELLKESQLRCTAGMQAFSSCGGAATVPENEVIKANQSSKTNNERRGDINGDVFQALESLLIEGQCEAAIQLACSQRQWGLGVLIALQDRESKSFQSVAHDCISNCIPPGHSSLRTLVLTLAGVDMKEGGMTAPQDLLNSWKLVASSYLTSDVVSCQGKLLKLGDDMLIMRELIEKESVGGGSGEQYCGHCKAFTQAAHTLYIMAGLAPQKPGKNSRMVLPGVDFSDPALRSFRSPESWDAMHILEVLEIIHGSVLTPVVLGHKLRLAMALADIGRLELAEAYANQVRRAVNSLAKTKKEKGNEKNIPYTEKFVEALSHFEERVALVLGKSPPSSPGERGAGRWLLKKMTDMVKSSSTPELEPKSKQRQQLSSVVQQSSTTDVDSRAAVNLPSSAAAVAHHQSNCSTTTTPQHPFLHGGPFYQLPSDKSTAATSEAAAAQPMQQQHGLQFANKQQQSTTSPSQVLFHPYTASNSMPPPSQQQGQYNVSSGSSVASQSEEPPPLPQSQLQQQQHPATMFHTFVPNPTQHGQDQTAPSYPEHPLEHQQQQQHRASFNSNMCTPTILQQNDYHNDSQSQEALQPEKDAAMTTDQSNTVEHSNGRGGGKGSGIRSAPISLHTTPRSLRDKKHLSSDTHSESPRPNDSKKPVNSQKGKSSGFLSVLVQKVAKVVHPDATMADLGGDMSAYWDENTKKWVFPTATEENSSEMDAIKQEPEKAANIPDSLAALMAPPPIQALGAGRVGAAAIRNSAPPMTTPMKDGSYQPVQQQPVCWTPPHTAGAGGS